MTQPKQPHPTKHQAPHTPQTHRAWLVLCMLLWCFAHLVACPQQTPTEGSITDAANTPGDGPSTELPTDTALANQGAALYATYCALCHGEKGEGYKADGANALNNPTFLRTATDELLYNGILKGRPGTTMSAWGQQAGGPLTETQANAIVAFIRTWQTQPSIDVHSETIEGKANRGELLYEFRCASCHGDKGQGGTHISINNPEFLSTASDGFLHYAITKGRPGTPMPAFGSTLTPQNIKDLVVLIRSWAKPPAPPPTNLPSKTLPQPILHPKGDKPDFPKEGEFIGIDELKAAYDKGARMIILDARPPADYVTQHIKGASSVPFYAVNDYLDQLPKDEWIITYCACPHAESGAARRKLIAAGYTQVKVLNEGFNEWTKRSYPTSTGIEP